MKVEKMAALIPAEYRKEILDLEMIDKAIPNSTDNTMYYLATIFKNYIEEDFDPACPLCYSRVIKFFQRIKPALEELEQQSRLLNCISKDAGTEYYDPDKLPPIKFN